MAVGRGRWCGAITRMSVTVTRGGGTGATACYVGGSLAIC
jgi:hypothetical protein